MKIGDSIICSNGHTYTLGKGDEMYTFSIIDEFGEEVNLVMDYYLEDCLDSSDEDYCELCIGLDHHNNMKKTQVLKLIEK